MTIPAGACVQQVGVQLGRRRPIVTLPTIKLKTKGPNGLVQPRAIREGDLCHVRIQVRAPRLWTKSDAQPSRRFYGVVPSAVAAPMLAQGIERAPGAVLVNFDRHDLTKTEERTASVRFDLGEDGRKSVLVPEETALRWAETIVHFQRLLDDYNAIMAGGIR